MSENRALGDFEGHPFRGNQYKSGDRVQIHAPAKDPSVGRASSLREGYAHGYTGSVVSGTGARGGYLRVKMDKGPRLEVHPSVLRHTKEMRDWDEDAVKAHDDSEREKVQKLQKSMKNASENEEPLVQREILYSLHLRGAAGAAQTEMVNGREHFVIPVVALMEGVIHPVNAESPEFVPWSTIEMMAASFDGKPVTLGHPAQNGKQCSAKVPGIMDSHGMGFIRNPRAVKETKRLLMDALVDKQKSKQLHPDMHQALLEEKIIEVSVGAFVFTDDNAGEHNGRRYNAKWMSGTGDHLAFLPGKRGACSVAMGCGAHRAAMHLVTAEGIEPQVELAPVLAFTTLEESSLDERMQMVYRAIHERWGRETMTVEQQIFPQPMGVFDDHVMVRVGDDVLDVAYAVKDGKVVLGDAKRVKQAWVAAERKGKYEDCPTCKGSGNKDGNPCPTCDGEGEIKHMAMATLLGACACTKALKELHEHAVKALGDKPFYGNQHASEVVEKPVLDVRIEGGRFILYGSDKSLRLGSYNTLAEAEEHGRAIAARLAR